MSVLDKLRELEDQRAILIEEAKAELLKAAQNAVAELNQLGKKLGFEYKLWQVPYKIQKGVHRPTNAKEDRERAILDLLAEHADGLFSSEICEKLNAEKTRVDNDLQALRKAGRVSQADAPDDRKQTGTKGKQPKLWIAA